jgi:DNA mismatch repair ATPase MutS
VLFQVGKFIEFYHQQDKFIARLLGLKPMSKNKRGALFGFPLTILTLVIEQIIINGFGCYVVKRIDIIDNIMQRKVDFAVISLQEESLIYSHKPRQK